MQRTIRDRWDKRKGSALLFSALMLVGTLGMVGFAVDGGTLFLVRARLSGAADGAALAASRSVSYASTVAQATAQATAVANQFFVANFPSGYLGTGATPTVTPVFTQEIGSNGNPDGILKVSLTASVQAPTYFMNLFGIHSVTVKVGGVASRRSLVLMLVLDQSNSMNTSTSPSACSAMKTAAANFITMLSPWDTVGMIKFDSSAHLTYPPSSNFGNGSLAAAISAITCNGNTGTTAALEMAYHQIVLTNLPLAFNHIALFTDGIPNGIAANFPVRRSVDTRWGPGVSSPSPPGGSLWGRNYTCSYNSPDNGPCRNMANIVTSAATVRGSLSAAAGQNSYGGYTFELYQPWGTPTADPAPVWPTLSSSCTIQSPAHDCNSQMYAYIPDVDAYGNSTHGVPATGTSPYGTVCSVGTCAGLDSRDLWLFNWGNNNTGDLWSNHSTVGSGSNYFPATVPVAGAEAYAGKLRVDQPNTVAAASMNSAMAEAYKIRSDTTFNITIHTLFLTGNNTDSLDREFLPIVANYPTIPALPSDPGSYVPYTNPAFQATQQQGMYLVTADMTQLTALFSELASQLLRISQ